MVFDKVNQLMFLQGSTYKYLAIFLKCVLALYKYLLEGCYSQLSLNISEKNV